MASDSTVHMIINPAIQMSLQDPKNSNQKVEKTFSTVDIVNSTLKEFRDRVSMNRAFPAYKLYIIDDNKVAGLTPGEARLNRTHTYDITDYLISARTFSSRKNPIDYMVLQLDDTDGYLYGAGEYTSTQKDQKETVFFDNSFYDAENFDNGGFIREGVSVELRLGYDNNAECLETVFIGQIASISGGDVLTVECQSWATEFFADTMISEAEKYAPGTNSNISKYWWKQGATTGNIFGLVLLGPDSTDFFGQPILAGLHKIADRLLHFGRYEIKSSTLKTNNIIPVSGQGQNAPAYQAMASSDRTVENIWSITVAGNNNIPLLGPNSPVTPRLFTDWIPSNWSTKPGNLRFNAYGLTPWEVMKEMELRHPGSHLACRPYRTNGTTEMTLFFGYPNLPYVYQGIDNVEKLLYTQEFVREYLSSPSAGSTAGITAYAYTVLGPQLAPAAQGIGKLFSRANITTQAKFYSSVTPVGNVRMFRKYHLVTSEHDIIENSLRLEGTGAGENPTYNCVRCWYQEGEITKSQNGSLPDNATRKYVDVLADDDISPADLRIYEFDAPNAESIEIARIYAAGKLYQLMMEFYSGEIILLGNENIQPHDCLIINDQYTGMFGAVGVREVEHLVSKETGFVTRVTPDMCVSVDYANSHILTYILTQILTGVGLTLSSLTREPSPTGLGVASWAVNFSQEGSLSLVGATLLGSPLVGIPAWLAQTSILRMAWWWLGKANTYHSPIIIFPVVKNGLPYVHGLRGYNRNNQSIGWLMKTKDKWYKADKFAFADIQRQMDAIFEERARKEAREGKI